VRKARERLAEYWRRSGGRLLAAAPHEIESRVARQLDAVRSWDDFLATRVTLDVERDIPLDTRHDLDALPSSLPLLGDRVAIEYEVEGAGENGEGVIRLRLKEGQARRLQPRDLPRFDRPVRFIVLRGRREAVRADTLDDLRRQLSGLSRGERDRLARAGPRRRRR